MKVVIVAVTLLVQRHHHVNIIDCQYVRYQPQLTLMFYVFLAMCETVVQNSSYCL